MINLIKLKLKLKRIIKITYVVLILLHPLSLFSQKVLFNERIIDSLFVELEKSDSLQASRYAKGNIRRYPFYESFEFQNFNNLETLKSGATCLEYKQSQRLELLKRIYIFSQNEDTSFAYSLVDSSDKIINDLRTYNCSGMKKPLGGVEAINQKAISEVIYSYQKWYDLVKKNGYSFVQNHRITPTAFTTYKWQKEIGFIYGKQSNSVLLKVGELILKDSEYLNYFIKRQRLKYIYSNKENKEIISELILLSIINNEYVFTSDVLKFKLSYGKSKTSENISYNLLQQMLTDKVDCSNSSDVYDFLKKNEVSITLK